MINHETTVITNEIASIIKALIELDYKQQDIAAYFHINQGAVSRIKNGKRFAEIRPAHLDIKTLH